MEKLKLNTIYQGDCLEVLKTFPDESINCVVTSPPYIGLRDYGHNGQLGLEKSPELYVEKLVTIFSEIKRILKNDGSLWLNLGDCYAGAGGMGSFVDNKAKKGMQTIKQYVRNKPIKGLKPKDLIGIPWRVAFALQQSGWYLRSDIIWHKPNPMPESVKDRPTKAHEYIFLLTKNARYYYDADSIKEKSIDPESYSGRRKRNIHKIAIYDTKHAQAIQTGKGKIGVKYEMRNKRSVWTVNTFSFSDAHFATFPPKLIMPCIKAGCPENGIVLDPFFGSGTTGEVALRLNRKFIGIELNPEYIKIANKRLSAHLQTLFTCTE